MKKIHYTIGLPRSGSTVLMNILQQNPEIFTSATCPTPYLVEACKIQATCISEFIAMDQDVLTKSLVGFIREGTTGWFNELTEKPTVISKSRTWDTHLNMLFNIYEKPKFIVCLRDLRDIICSFEKFFKQTSINEDKSINMIWEGSVPLFSPIPTLALHVSQGNEPPFVDYKTLWNSIEI